VRNFFFWGGARREFVGNKGPTSDKARREKGHAQVEELAL